MVSIAIFFENAQESDITVNSERYVRLISEYFWREIKDYNLDDMWFLVDGATSRFS